MEIIYFDDIPQEEHEAFSKFLFGQTIPRKDCAWKHDYIRFKKSGL